MIKYSMKEWIYTITLILGIFAYVTKAVDWDVITPLDEYVHQADPSYGWVEINQIKGDGYTVHVLNMTSQTWRDESYTEEPVWWHFLSVFVPDAPLIHDAAYLVIGNGNNNEEPPTLENDVMLRTGSFAKNTGAVSAYLRAIPFQPIHFDEDRNDTIGNGTIGKIEDFIIGHTWGVYIENPEETPDAIVLFPMVKAAKHALDTVHDFMAQKYTGYEIDKFMPAGFSKRGWTTWLLGCTDQRVFAMVPTVFDLLNMAENLEHHYRSFGGWSWAFAPYWYEDVPRYLYHPRFLQSTEVLDPLSFNERLTMPKLLMAAAGDQFFPPDGTHYFWDQLTPPKYFQMFENDDHTLPGHLDERDANIQAFFLSTYRNDQLPQITWTRTENATAGIITVQTSPSVVSITGWTADTTNVTCEVERNNTCRRDFRQMTLNGETGIWWNQNEVVQTGIDQYTVVMNKRDDFGFRGFYIQMVFDGPENYQLTFTTEVNIIPDILPYPKCETEDECAGRLI